MMRSPAAALVWETWRLARRRAGFAAVIATIGSGAVLLAAGERSAAAGILAVVIVTMTALLSVLDLPIVKTAFAFRSSFARPVSTRVLVLSPMLFLAALGALLYAVPIVALNALLGAQIPVATVSTWLAALVFGMTAVSWSTYDPQKGRDRAALRLALRVAVFLGVLQLTRIRTSFDWFPETVTTDTWRAMLRFSFIELALLGALSAAALGVTLRSVGRQRHVADGSATVAHADAWTTSLRALSAETLRARALDAILPCPTLSPGRAELWREIRRRGLPSVAMSLAFALVIPGLLALGDVQQWTFPVLLAFAALAVPWLVALNFMPAGRVALPSALGPFEATRPIATARLASIRVGVTAAAVLLGTIAIGASLSLSLPRFSNVWDPTPMWRALAADMAAMSAPLLASRAAAGIVLFLAVIGTLSALNAFFVLYGRRLGGAILVAAVYTIALMVTVAVGGLSPAVLIWHLWALAAAVGASSVWWLVRAVSGGLLRPRHAGAAVAVWLSFAALWWAGVAGAVGAAGLLSATAAGAALAGLLPLWSVAGAPWSLHRLRHT